jgi:hypothetical protein
MGSLCSLSSYLGENLMPMGKGTYGSKVGRPPKKNKKKIKKGKK